MLFLCSVQLVLRSGVLTILDLDEVDVTPRFAEVFRSYETYDRTSLSMDCRVEP